MTRPPALPSSVERGYLPAVSLHAVGKPGRRGLDVGGPVHPYPLVWLPGTHTLCIGSVEGSVHLWDLDDGEVEVLAPQTGNVWALDVSPPDGRTLAIGTQDGVLKLTILPTRWEIAVLKGHLTAISEVAFSPDGRRLISASEFTRIWRVLPLSE